MTTSASLGATGATLEEVIARGRAAWQEVWAEQDAPAERYTIAFKSGWAECGLAMHAICSRMVSDVAWRHDPPHHAVQFTCSFPELKSVQAAVLGTPVRDLRCHRG